VLQLLAAFLNFFRAMQDTCYNKDSLNNLVIAGITAMISYYPP